MDDMPKELHEVFPDHAEKIAWLKERDPAFKRKADEFHELSRAVHRAQMDEEPVEEVDVSELRKKRDMAKDELMRLIMF